MDAAGKMDFRAKAEVVFLRAVLGTFIPIIVLLLSGQTFAEDASSFNRNGSVKEYIRHGTIYDRN